MGVGREIAWVGLKSHVTWWDHVSWEVWGKAHALEWFVPQVLYIHGIMWHDLSNIYRFDDGFQTHTGRVLSKWTFVQTSFRPDCSEGPLVNTPYIVLIPQLRSDCSESPLVNPIVTYTKQLFAPQYISAICDLICENRPHCKKCTLEIQVFERGNVILDPNIFNICLGPLATSWWSLTVISASVQVLYCETCSLFERPATV